MISVTILFGKQKIEVDTSPAEQISILRRHAEQKLDLVEGGLRLLHKGKSLNDTSAVESFGITTGTKLMALRTQKQHTVDRDRERHLKLQQQQKNSKSASSSSSSSSSPPNSTNIKEVMGDPEISDAPYIIVQKSRDKYRINTSPSMTLEDMKKKLSKMIPGVDARDIRLLSSGKFLRDNFILNESGIKQGATIMALFSARHHDKVEARSDIKKYTEQVVQLEDEYVKLRKRVKHRLIPTDELSIAQSRFKDDVHRLRDNIQAVNFDDDVKEGLEKRLTKLDTDFIDS